jgi:hypothetical protein
MSTQKSQIGQDRLTTDFFEILDETFQNHHGTQPYRVSTA